ncbi:MAG: ATP-binding protein [Desulfobulbus sp.]|nr:ATP-binding protein [Desulfobulbus sp.]
MGRKYSRLWWRYFLAIIGFSVIPFLFVHLSLSTLFDRIYTARVTESLRTSVENRRDAIDLFLNERITQLFTVANTATFPELTDEAALGRLLGILRARSDYYTDISIIDREGNHLASAGTDHDLLKSANSRNEPWFNEVRAKGIHIGDLCTAHRTSPHATIAVMVRDKKSPLILRVSLNPKGINDLVQQAWTGTIGDAFLVNSKNRLQTVPRFGGEFLTAPTLSRSAAGSSEPVLYPDLSSTVKTRVEQLSLGGTNVFLAAAPLRNTGWVLVLKQNRDEILSPLVKGRYWMALLTALGLAVIAAGAALFTNGLINRIRETDRENAAKSDMLLQANKMIALSKMAANVAHEVNNPLASISETAGWLQDLLAAEDLAASPNFAEFKDSVEKIEHHVERARKIIHNLLGFARRIEPAREDFDINTLLDETTGLLENEARYANIRIDKQYADNVPVITSDLSQIQQVVLNLLNNAIDAIGSNGTITVGSHFLEQNDTVEMWVADSGKGIPEEELDKIFEPFFTTKAVGKGTGLGLSIAHGIIEKLGGTMRVQSKAGEGTVFTITLPKN